jgi:pyruvate-ferredoxin/flavodoxin oxidoreductase
MDGNTAVIMCEREASDAAGAYPITPSTQMGEYWAEETARGHINVSDRALIFIEPESEHAAAAVTAGMSMSGLRATNFSSAQGIAFMHESLYAAVGKRLPYVLNIGCRAITKASLNVHCGHDDYHCIDDTGFIQVMAKSAQEAADLNLIARKLAELALTPAAVAQDGFLTTHLIETMRVPERGLVREFLGRPDDLIETPTPAQRLIYGEKRRRVPEIWDVDNPMLSGSVQNQDAYMQAVAAQRPYFFAHIRELAERVMDEYYELTGRRYRRVSGYRLEDADYVILGQGSMVVQAEALADYLRETRRLKVGVVNITMYRPFPGDLVGKAIKGKKGVAVLERTDQPLAEDLPLMRDVRAAVTKCIENNVGRGEEKPYPAYETYRNGDAPRLYSGCYGLGSRDLQPEGIIAAVENMLPEGKRKKFFYLSIDFAHGQAANPKQEIHQQQVLDLYPAVKDLALRGSENPDLMPKGSITVRMHSVGGWGAITTGKNLVMTLYDLLGYHIKANPKYGSEKKGQPTTYYLSVAPEPIRVNCEYHYVDVVISPDPNVFEHSNALAGLDHGGVFIIQSDLDSPEKVWAHIPRPAQQFIVEHNIRVFYVDGFRIAREEARDPELQLRMQGNAFQGAFFKASPVMARANLTEEALFKAIETQLRDKFGAKGKRVVEDNLRVVRRGFDEVREITEKKVAAAEAVVRRREAAMPIMLKQLPASSMSASDIQRFWEQTGSFYASGKGSDNLADPFMALSLVPASTGVFRDMTQIRFEYPKWIPGKCTACGDCYAACPDSAIPGLVSTIGETFETAIRRIETRGRPTQYLRRQVRAVEKRLRALLEAAGEDANVRELLDRAVLENLAESGLEGEMKAQVEKEFGWLMESLGEFRFALTKPHWTTPERKAKGNGGLFSITVNPYTCKGCMECVTVCDDGALERAPQTPEAVARLRRDWEFWLDLPNTPAEFIRIDDLDERIGALEMLLLDKRNYGSMVCGDGACLGCGEKTAIHLFTATVTALMQARVKKHLGYLEELIQRLENHIRLRLAATVDLSNTSAIREAVEARRNGDLTLSNLAESLDARTESHPLDKEWLGWVTGTLDRLRDLKWRYTEGPTRRGRAALGIINATGCTSVWGSTYPFHPYPFPWTSHLFQDSPSVAMGVFEGHMAKMAEGFKAIRMAELELEGKYNPQEHDAFFRRFGWRDFSDEEYRLCPPVVSIGGDGAMYDIGFQNLSRMMMSGRPIKVMVVDTQVYSNTGGQACTSGFIGQVADMTPYGTETRGKQETRKEMGLIGMAHRTTYVLQGAVSSLTHLIEGYIEGLNSRRPAVFNIYSVCQPEHGVGDDKTFDQSKLAVESRAYPLFRFDPDAGETLAECCSIEGNPALDADWPTYTLEYTDEESGEKKKLELPLTFADFAATEGRFRKHFKRAPRETWNDDMVLLTDFLKLSEDDREGKFPYIWMVDGKGRLQRALVAQEIVHSTEERRQFWRQLKGLAGADRAAEAERVARVAREDLVQKLTQSLTAMAVSGDAGASLARALGGGVTDRAPAGAVPAAGAAAADWEPAWIETPLCDSCDECIDINANIFAYNEEGKAYVKDPKAGLYRDIVRAAEKCTVGAIHPGTPFNRNEPGLGKLIQRAAKFQ